MPNTNLPADEVSDDQLADSDCSRQRGEADSCRSGQRRGQHGAALAVIDTLHTRAGIPPFVGTTQAQIQAQIVEERRRELFLESQRLGDIIRYNLR